MSILSNVDTVTHALFSFLFTWSIFSLSFHCQSIDVFEYNVCPSIDIICLEHFFFYHSTSLCFSVGIWILLFLMYLLIRYGWSLPFSCLLYDFSVGFYSPVPHLFLSFFVLNKHLSVLHFRVLFFLLIYSLELLF